ncbi:MAG TPA: arginine N-succinyltransferase [Polyangiaceae bacterium]
MPRYEVHGATSTDERELLELARHLNTVNLPNSRAHVVRLLDHSARSFAGELPPAERKFVFVLRDVERGRAVGTSTLVAQLGRRDAPYIYLDVIREEKYSRRLDRHFRHKLLRIGFSYDGPTELAGLVVDPEYRRAPERLGLVIACVRFLYVAMHRALFQDQLLAELLPPLEPDGTSHLWEAFGRRFTQLDYAEADLLSSEDKTFISDLFPNGVVHASLFSPEAQNVIGKVGHQTLGVEKMLRRVGFRYADRIDPFDGGPHFVAETGEVTLVKCSRRVRLGGVLDTPEPDSSLLVGRDLEAAPYFRAAIATHTRCSAGELELPAAVLDQLGVSRGDEVFTLPLGARRQQSGAPAPV